MSKGDFIIFKMLKHVRLILFPLTFIILTGCGGGYISPNPHAQSDYERGLHYYRAGEYQQAVTRFRSAVTRDSAHDPARRYLKRAEEAISAESSAAVGGDQRELIMQRLAQQVELRNLRNQLETARSEGDVDGVRETVQKILQINPNDDTALAHLQDLSTKSDRALSREDAESYLDEAARLMDSNLFEDALKEINRFLLLFPTDQSARRLRNEINRRIQGADHDRQLQEKFTQQRADFLYRRGLNFMASEDYVEAILSFQDAQNLISGYEDTSQLINRAQRALQEQTRDAIDRSLLYRAVEREYRNAIRSYLNRRYERAMDLLYEIEGHIRLEQALRYKELLEERMEAETAHEEAVSIYSRARMKYFEGDIRNTYEMLTRALKLSPNYFEAKHLYDEVSQMMNRERSINSVLAEAEALLSRNDRIGAVERAQKVFEFQPREPRAAEFIKDIAQHFSKGMRVNPAEYELYIQNAKREQGRNRFNEAIVEWGKVLSLNPENTEAANNIKISKQRIRRRQREEEERIRQEQIEEARAELMERINELLQRADRMQTNGQHQDAIDIWKEVLEIDPGNSEAERGIKNSEEALAAEIPDGVDEAEIERIYREGLILFHNGDYRGAIREWDRVLMLAPNHERARNNRAIAEQRLGR